MGKYADELIERSEYSFGYFKPTTYAQNKKTICKFLKQFAKSGITNKSNDEKLLYVLKEYATAKNWSKRSSKCLRNIVNTLTGANFQSFKEWYLTNKA